MRMTTLLLAISATLAPVAALSARSAYAHCDTLDGPVVTAGRRALDTGDLDHALIWVQPESEAELRAAFQQTLAVRNLGTDARALADRYFFETLVRLHRAGEGEPYTGIAPAGADLGPAIPAADASIASGSPRAVTKLATDAATAGIKRRLDRVLATRKYAPHDVAAGREYVEAYVAYLHYVERLYDDATAAAHHAEAEAHR